MSPRSRPRAAAVEVIGDIADVRASPRHRPGRLRHPLAARAVGRRGHRAPRARGRPSCPLRQVWVNPDCGLKTRGYDETVELARATSSRRPASMREQVGVSGLAPSPFGESDAAADPVAASVGVRSSVGDSSAGRISAVGLRRRRSSTGTSLYEQVVAPPRRSSRAPRGAAAAVRGSTRRRTRRTRTSTMSPTESGRRAKSHSTASTAMIVRTRMRCLPSQQPERARCRGRVRRARAAPRRSCRRRRGGTRVPGADRPITQPEHRDEDAEEREDERGLRHVADELLVDDVQRVGREVEHAGARCPSRCRRSTASTASAPPPIANAEAGARARRRCAGGR